MAFATDTATTIRKALTTAQTAGETPNAVIVNPADAEALDLSRWGASGGFLMPDAFSAVPGGNVFGGAEIQRVISPSVPAGTAVLGDFTKIGLYIREAVGIAIDAGGDLFTKNQFIARCEARIGLAHLRPSAFLIADLTA